MTQVPASTTTPKTSKPQEKSKPKPIRDRHIKDKFAGVVTGTTLGAGLGTASAVYAHNSIKKMLKFPGTETFNRLANIDDPKVLLETIEKSKVSKLNKWFLKKAYKAADKKLFAVPFQSGPFTYYKRSAGASLLMEGTKLAERAKKYMKHNKLGFALATTYGIAATTIAGLFTGAIIDKLRSTED